MQTTFISQTQTTRIPVHDVAVIEKKLPTLDFKEWLIEQAEQDARKSLRTAIDKARPPVSELLKMTNIKEEEFELLSGSEKEYRLYDEWFFLNQNKIYKSEIDVKILGISADTSPILRPISKHGFADALEYAYCEHKPLVISPDMMWLLICQGLADHIRVNAEALRNKFVTHQGKKELEVKVMSIENDVTQWAYIISEFKNHIADNIHSDIVELMSPRFSTTTFDTELAFQITLMHALNTYFDYVLMGICGIPYILLEGTPDDWALIEQRLPRLEQYDLKWWTDALKPILKEFTRAAQGKINPKFWKNIYYRPMPDTGCVPTGRLSDWKKQSPHGWLKNLFPYVGTDVLKRNPTIGTQKGLNILNNICESASFVPLKIIGLEYEHITLQSGFRGVQIDETTFAVRPKIAWTVIGSRIKA